MTLYTLLLTVLIGCWHMGCASYLRSSVESKDSKPHRPQTMNEENKTLHKVIRINLFLDLATRQTLIDEKWRRPIFNHLSDSTQAPKTFLMSSMLLETQTLYALEYTLNESFKQIGIEVRLSSIHPWESSVDGKALSLDHLAHTLRSKLLENTNTINVGMVSTSLPSFAQLSDLLWSRSDVPVVIVRRPLQYYGEALEPTAQATARLMVRGIGEFLGIAPICDGGWGGATRDQLLGLIVPRKMRVTPNDRSTVVAARDPFLRGVPLDQEPEEQTEVQWAFSDLSWSSGSKQIFNLLKAHQDQADHQDFDLNKACLKFEVLNVMCEHNTPIKNTLETEYLMMNLGDQCMSRSFSLMDLYNKGLLTGKMWSSYHSTALGLSALKKGQYQLAYDHCRKVANHRPSLLASKCAGMAAESLGQLDFASLYLRAYLSSHPDDVEALSRLAKILGKKGKDREALALLRRLALEKSEQLGHEKSKILFNLGVAEARLGNIDAAKKSWAQLDQRSEEYKTAMELIQALSTKD